MQILYLVSLSSCPLSVLYIFINGFPQLMFYSAVCYIICILACLAMCDQDGLQHCFLLDEMLISAMLSGFTFCVMFHLMSCQGRQRALSRYKEDVNELFRWKYDFLSIWRNKIAARLLNKRKTKTNMTRQILPSASPVQQWLMKRNYSVLCVLNY